LGQELYDTYRVKSNLFLDNHYKDMTPIKQSHSGRIMKSRKNIVIITVIMITVVILSLFVYLNSQGRFYDGESIILGVPPNEQSALIFIAEDQQYFSANGLNATVKVYPTALAALDGLLNEEVDVSQTAELPIVSKSFAKENISIVASIDKFLNMFLVARKDHEIEAISDLKGKTIGSAKGTLTEFHLGRFLNLNGLSLQDVNIVNIPFSQSEEALANGTVDAFQAQNRDLPRIKAKLDEDNLEIWPSQSGQSGFEIISGRKEWVDNNPEPITRLLKSLAQAEEYAAKYPNEALAIVQEKLGYDDEYIATIGPQHTYSLSLDQSLILAMEDEARWMITNNLTNETQTPDFMEYLYIDYLAAVKPEAVNIIR
jgi:ABC-type nitrate/sulfonate/bicarbonate transport system substrate-binding protein